jgi:flagellar biosynthesis protein FlhA
LPVLTGGEYCPRPEEGVWDGMLQQLWRYRDLILPVGLIACLLVILVPLPPVLMDILLAINITASVVILLTTIYVGTPLEFNIFPSVLLVTTIGRLVLNVATTRLILTRASSEKMEAAGGVIQGFGEFVAGDRLVVGIIIFVILIVIQFVVITKGATRISEVAARFALDGMPGKQMAIDADLNAGIIDEKEAQRRREEIAKQADFYGAMDGASKFVRNDAIAGIVILFVNIIGGLYIGCIEDGMPLAEAAELFTKLTIGDGLVSQVPAFLISLAAGFLVTRSAQKSNLPVDFLQQLLSNPRALVVAGGFLVVLAFTNLPPIPLSTIAIGCVGLAIVTRREADRRTQQQADQKEAEANAKQVPAERRTEDYLTVDPVELTLGLGLLRLADPSRGGDLLERITGVRNHTASDMGIILPKVRVRDDMELGDLNYEIKLTGSVVGRGSLRPDQFLAIDSGMTTGVVEGEATREPIYGQPAIWVSAARREQAIIYGYSLYEPAAALSAHLQDVARRHADELLTRDAAKHLLNELKQAAPTVVDELVPGVMKLAEVQQVLQALLREDVPIRQLSIILETLGDFAGRTKDPVWLSEYVRHRLARTLCSRYRSNDGRLHVVTMDPAMEDRVAAGIEHTERGLFIRMSPAAVETTNQRIATGLQPLLQAGRPPVLLVSPRIRPGLRQLTSAALPRIHILSYNEVTTDTSLESVGIISDTKG